MTARRFTLTANGAASAADGGTNSFEINSKASFVIRGDLGGGTVTVQTKIARYYDGSLSLDSDFVNIGNSSGYTVESSDNIEAAKNVTYRFFISGATSPNVIIDIETGF